MKTIILWITFLSIIFPQTNEHFLRFTTPSRDTILTNSNRHNIMGSTNPEAKIFVNNKELKVYESGGFVDLLDLQLGENVFVFESVLPNGEKISEEKIFIRNPGRQTTDENIFTIEEIMLPDSDIWLSAGDILQVKIKGTPNCKATFMNGIEMFELPLSVTNNIGGIYQGTYLVKENDYIEDASINFILTNKNGETTSIESKVKISFINNKLPLTGITKGNNVYLNYGLGGDRLGGAKLSFMEEGIKLNIIGKNAGQYKVKLTNSLDAWIPVEQVDLLPQGTYPPYSLTGSWSLTGDEKYNYLSIGLSEKLPFSSYQETNPNKIIIDIYGAVSNTNWITQHLTADEVEEISYQQVETNLFRVNIKLKSKLVWGYGISYSGNSLRIKIKKQPKEFNLSSLKIAVDAGHGGNNNGAIGVTGTIEKNITLQFANKLKEELEKNNVQVYMTRNGDEFSNNFERLNNVLKEECDLLISIHCNSIGSTTHPEKVKGLSTYYKHIIYKPLAEIMYNTLLKTELNQFGLIGGFNFTLNSSTEIPNVLIETAFLSNPEDEMLLNNPEFIEKFVKLIVEGIEDYIKLSKN